MTKLSRFLANVTGDPQPLPVIAAMEKLQLRGPLRHTTKPKYGRFAIASPENHFTVSTT